MHLLRGARAAIGKRPHGTVERRAYRCVRIATHAMRHWNELAPAHNQIEPYIVDRTIVCTHGFDCEVAAADAIVESLETQKLYRRLGFHPCRPGEPEVHDLHADTHFPLSQPCRHMVQVRVARDEPRVPLVHLRLLWRRRVDLGQRRKYWRTSVQPRCAQGYRSQPFRDWPGISTAARDAGRRPAMRVASGSVMWRLMRQS
jgi:hypothetical protein